VATPKSLDLVEPVLRPLHSGNAFEETVERLLRLIKLGVVSLGEQLPPERELASRMGVSRETLREALRSLRDAGYLQSRRGRTGGTFVLAREGAQPAGTTVATAPLDAGGVEDLLAVRFALETGAAELAARRDLPPSAQAELQRLHDECCTAPLPEYRRADSRLHLTVAELAGAPSLAAAVATARAHANDLLDGIPLLARNIEHSNQQHERIVQALLRRDPMGARAAMVEHLDGTAALLRAFLA
jgi:DNA-binding FadR family transcriptional regulator